MPTRPPQVRLPTSGPSLNLRNIHGSRSPPEPAVSSMSITLGPEDRGVRRADRLAVARRPVADQRAAEEVDVVVGHLAAAVEPLVDDDGLLVGLREEVALEVRVARAGRVGHVDVGHAALGPLVDLAQVALDPVAVAQRRLVRDRLDDDGAGPGAVGLGADLELGPLADGALEVRVDLAVGLDVLAVDGQQVVAGLDVHARRGERGAEARDPSRPRRRSS